VYDVRVQSLNHLRTALDDLIRLHAARWSSKGHRGAFAQPAFEALVRSAAADSFLHGRLGLWQIFSGGRCLAALIAFIDFGTAHYFQGGFDPRAPQGVGRTLVGVAIRDCVLASGIRRFDLMGGGREAGYKADWTGETVEILELECLGSGLRPRLFKLIRDSRDGLARVLQYLPEPAAQTVRAGLRRLRPASS
jgi:CelD/BcsL family acetyltransferase involved in cellulose biosynthesis